MLKRLRPKSDEDLFPSLRGQGLIGFDLETKDEELKERGAGYHRDGTHIAGVAVGTEAGFRGYYPTGHETGPLLEPPKVMAWLREQLALPVAKVGSNISYDLGFLAREKVFPVGPFYDTQVAEPLLDENRFQYGIDALGRDRLGEGKKDDELKAYLTERFGRKNPMRYIWRAPSDLAAPYAVGDVDLSIRVFLDQKQQLERENLWPLFMLETRLIPMLLAMRQRGVRVDVGRAEEMDRDLGLRFHELSGKIVAECGLDVEIWAAVSVERAFNAVGVTNYPRTPKTAAPSFTSNWLEACPHPLAELILEARRVDKLRGTFIQGQILGNHYRGRVHCQFNQLKGDGNGTVSGRFSAQLPNLQFIPMRTEEGKKIREVFLPERDEDWGKADYSQIELRFAVHDAVKMKLRGAAELAKRYYDDPKTDPYQEFADDPDTGLVKYGPKDGRRKAKTIVLAILYGEGVLKMSRQLGLSLQDGDALYRHFNAKVPFFRQLTRTATNMAQATGVITTFLGRKRRFETWTLKRRVDGKLIDVFLPHRVSGARRAFTHAAFNARDQGSAADIMKKAMVDIWESGVCAPTVLGAPLITVHDELDWSVPRSRVGREAFRETARMMSEAVKLTVPLRVDAERGPNWGDLSEMGDQDLPERRRRVAGRN